MQPRAGRKLHLLWLALFALGCAVLYHVLAERQARVGVRGGVEAPACFKIYWLGQDPESVWSERHSRLLMLRPETHLYTFKLTDLSRVALLRIDPSEEERSRVSIRSITLTQDGYAPIHLAGREGLSRLVSGEQDIEALYLADDGLTVVPSGRDPQLFFDLPSALRTRGHSRAGALLPLALVFVGVLLAGLVLERCFEQGDTLVVVCLAMVFVLIACMATLSRVGVHPDEGVHVRAADYFQQHVLPPPVGAPDIGNTYSVYGVSRLHSGEIAYLLLGKCARLFHALALPSYMVERYCNVAFWGLLLLLAVACRDFRLLMLPMLLSPQIWYIFSYVNSEAFACLVMMLAAWQLASPESAWNRLLAGGADGTKASPLAYLWLGLLFALLLLIKKNFYFFVLFLGGYVLWRLLWGYTPCQRGTLRRMALVLLIGLSVFAAVRGTDEYINGFDKEARLLQARYHYAGELWNPGTPLEQRHGHLQMRERGTSAARLMWIDGWGAKSFHSAFGLYGETSVSAAPSYYRLVMYAGLLLLAAAAVSVLVHGGWPGITLACLGLICAGALMAVDFYHAWTVDFQPQGRYLLPIVGMLGVLCLHARAYLFRSVAPLLCAAMFLLSLYSFVCVGLAGIGKIC